MKNSEFSIIINPPYYFNHFRKICIIINKWRPIQVRTLFFSLKPQRKLILTVLIIGVSSQRRKSRKAHFTAPSSIRRKMMSCHLSKELRSKWDCRSIPVRKGDTVLIKTGSQENGVKGKTGKVLTVYRRRWCIHVEKVVRDKKNGSQVPIPVNPSNCEITQLKLDKSRKALLGRKNRTNKAGAGASAQDWSSISISCKRLRKCHHHKILKKQSRTRYIVRLRKHLHYFPVKILYRPQRVSLSRRGVFSRF